MVIKGQAGHFFDDLDNFFLFGFKGFIESVDFRSVGILQYLHVRNNKLAVGIVQMRQFAERVGVVVGDRLEIAQVFLETIVLLPEEI